MPVGYHVTVPCNKYQTGFKTFDSAFAIDRGDSLVVKIRYMHTMLRDPDRYHSQYGTAGFCRVGNYGMPPFVTNTMRVCTRDAIDASYDATVPAMPRYKDGSSTPIYTDEESCSTSPYEVPWVFNDTMLANPSMLTIGNAPMYRAGAWGSYTKYPSNDRAREIQNTHTGTLDESWGDSCMDGELLFCDDNNPCVPIDDRVELDCVRNVCAIRMSTSGTCYSHADCTGENRLCSGDGSCVEGIWQVENELDDDIGFELYTESCGGDNNDFRMEEYDMYGASPWENVPDVLEMYGMCSYRDWFEYVELVDPVNRTRGGRSMCASQSTVIGCEPESFDVDNTLWQETNRPHSEPNMRSIWSTNRFRVQAHPCDMDYMHMDGLKGCSPVVLNDNSAMGVFDKSSRSQPFRSSRARRNRNVQTIERFRDGDNNIKRFINMIGRPPKVDLGTDWRSVGFMSMDDILPESMRRCNALDQCFVDTFTFNGGRVDDRHVLRDGILGPWDPQDSDACGGSGIIVSDSNCNLLQTDHNYCCQLDRAVLPLFEVFCSSNNEAIRSIESSCNLDMQGNPGFEALYNQGTVNRICREIGGYFVTSKSSKEKRETRLTQVKDQLNQLFDMLIPR